MERRVSENVYKTLGGHYVITYFCRVFCFKRFARPKFDCIIEILGLSTFSILTRDLLCACFGRLSPPVGKSERGAKKAILYAEELFIFLADLRKHFKNSRV